MTDAQTPSAEAAAQMAAVFECLNEAGIITQLATTLMAKTLPDGVHPSHFAILNHLVRTGDGKTPIRIAQAMQVTKMTMTHSLKVLTERGFIRTAPNPDDARGKLVFLTEAGHAFRGQAIAALGQRYGKLFDPEIRDVMARLTPELRKLRQFLDANRTED